MDLLTFPVDDENIVQPEIKALYFCLVLGIGSSIILILYVLKESKKLKDFFIVGIICLCISLAVLYNLWNKNKNNKDALLSNERILYFQVCITVLVSAGILSSALGDIKPYFNIISFVAIFLAAETSAIFFIRTRDDDKRARELACDINIAINLFIGSLMLMVIGCQRAAKKQIIGKILIFLMGFIAFTYSSVFTTFMILGHKDACVHKRLLLFRYYYVFVTNALLPGCALLLLREIGDLEKESDEVNLDGNYPDNSRAILY